MEDNKAIIGALYDSMNRLDAAGMLTLLATEATWWTPTDAVGGRAYSKDMMAAILPAMFAAFEHGPKMELGRLLVEGDRVCAEVTARGGVTKGGYKYENDYLMLFTVQNGLIVEVREFLNPLFAGPLAAEIGASAA